MTGRQIHQGPRFTDAAPPGDKAASGELHRCTDLPAPSEAAGVPSPLGTSAASTLAAWILDHARTDVLRGRPLPDEVAAHVRGILNPPMSAHGPKNGPTETIEITTAQMARRMGCSSRHVRRLISAGSLRARRAGRDWLIAVEEEPDDDHEGRHTR